MITVMIIIINPDDDDNDDLIYSLGQSPATKATRTILNAASRGCHED